MMDIAHLDLRHLAQEVSTSKTYFQFVFAFYTVKSKQVSHNTHRPYHISK